MQIIIIISLILAVSAVVFALQNPAVIVISFFFWELEGSLALILLVTFSVGFISSFLISSASRIAKYFKGNPSSSKSDQSTDLKDDQ